MSLKNRLKGLRIGELSLVTRPANQGAESLLHKMDTTEGTLSLLQKFLAMVAPIDKGDATVDLSAPEVALGSTTLALHTAVDSIMADNSLTAVEKVAKFNESVTQYREAVLALPPFPQSESTMAEKNDATTKDTPVTKSAEVLQAEESARASITKAQQERDEARAELTKLQETTKAGERKTLAKSLVEKTNVAVEPVELLLKELDGKPEAITALKTIVGKNEAAVRDGKVLDEVGKTVGNETAVTPVVQLQKYADEIQKADPKLTGPQAFAKAMELHQDLYEASLAPAAQ